MGDPKPTEQKEQLQPSKSPEETPAAQEAKEKMRQHEKEEEGIQQESVHKRTDTKLEMLEQQDLYSPDTKTAEAINGMDVENMEKEEEIQSSLELLGTVSVSILAKMFQNGFEQDEIDTLDEFKVALDRIESEEKFAKLKEKISNVTEKATFQKLREILYKPSSKVYKKLEAKWTEYMEKSKEVINDADKGTASKAWEYVKKNPRNVVLAVAGAFGLYALYKAFTSEEKETEGEKKEWTERIFNKKAGGAALLGVLLIGTLLGSKKIMKLIDGLTGDKKEMALRAAENAKEAAINGFNKLIHFDETKDRLLQLMPQKPEWLKTAKLENIVKDMGIDPEKTLHLEKYSGPGGAALLLKDWITRKHKLDAATQKILGKFLDKEKTATPESSEKNKAEIEKEYGEMVPLKDAWKNWGPHLEKALIEIKKWANENKELIAAAALFLASFESIRENLKKGLTMGFDGFVALAKLPWKAVKGFPMTSFFVVSAALFAADAYKDAAGNILVPKDPENFKKYAAKRVEDAGAWIEELPHAPKQQIEKAVEIIQTPGLIQQYLGPAEEMLEDVGVNILKMATLSERELLMKTNEKGLYSFATDLRGLQLDYPEGSEEFDQFGELVKFVKELRNKAKSGALVQNEDLMGEFAKKATPLGINILIHDGYVAWTWKKFQDGVPVLNGPRNIMVDSTLEPGEARDKAQRFVSQDSVANIPGKVIETFTDDIRIFWDKILFQDAKNAEDMTRIVDKKLNNGGFIAVYGGMAWLYEGGKGVLHRYALGPINLVKHIFKGLTGDFSAVDLAVDYGSGLLPVAIMGTTVSLARGEFMKVITGKVVVQSLSYPIKGLADLGHLGLHFARNIQKPHAMVKDPAYKVTSHYFEAVNRFKMQVSRFRRNSPMKKILKSEFNDLAALYQAKGYLHEAEYKSFLNEPSLHNKTQEALRDVEGINSQKIQRDPKGLMEDINRQIQEREQFVGEIEKFEQLDRAHQKMKEGKTKQAERILEKMGYKTPTSQEAIQKELDATKQSMESLDQKLNGEKRNKNVDREKGILEAEKSIGETKLTEAEKTKLVETLKESKPELEKLTDEGIAAQKAEIERATKEGRPISHPEVQKRLNEVRAEYDGKFAHFYETKGLHNLDLLDDAVLREHGFDPAVVREKIPHLEAKVKTHGTIKRIGKGVLGFAAALLAMYGISKGIEWFHSEERGFDFESAETSSSPEEKKAHEESQKKMKDNPEYHEQILKQIEFYFAAIEKDYMPLNELLGDPKKLNETSDDQLKKLVDEASGKHKANIEKLKNFVAANKEAILLYYERLPKAKEGKDRSLGQFFSIGFDEDDNRPYLKYADESDLRQTYYEIVDIYRAHIEQLLKGEPLTGWDTAVHAGSYAVPVYGTYLDGRDAVRAIGRGEWTTAAKSGGWCVLGAVSDVLMVAGIVSFGTTTVAGGAMKALRVGGAGAKGVVAGERALAVLAKIEKGMQVLRESKKLATAAKYSHMAMTAGIAIDVGRQVFIAPKSQTYYF